jgi:galactokinase/mevalonate kinase-like predicted kinase
MTEAGNIKENLTTEAQRTAKEAGEKIKAEGERLVDEAQRKAQEVVVARKQAAAEFMHDMSEAVSKATEVLDQKGHRNAASLLKSAAGELDRLSTSVSNREIDSLLRDMRDIAHRKPSIFFGAALLVGFGAARFLTASASRSRHEPVQAASPGDYGSSYGEPMGSSGSYVE